MKDNVFFNDIEKAYLSNHYQDVIDIWINYKENYSLSFNEEIDKKILQAIVLSYFKLGKPKESIYYIDKYISFIKNHRDFINVEDLDFYFLVKSSIYSKQKKRVLEYNTLREYIKLGGGDKNLLKSFCEVEEFLYFIYMKFNLYFIYSFIVLIITNNFFRVLLHASINPIIMISIVIVGLLWICANYLSKNLSKTLFKGLMNIF